jgi:hypothetical protein
MAQRLDQAMVADKIFDQCAIAPSATQRIRLHHMRVRRPVKAKNLIGKRN